MHKLVFSRNQSFAINPGCYFMVSTDCIILIIALTETNLVRIRPHPKKNGDTVTLDPLHILLFDTLLDNGAFTFSICDVSAVPGLRPKLHSCINRETTVLILDHRSVPLWDSRGRCFILGGPNDNTTKFLSSNYL